MAAKELGSFIIGLINSLKEEMIAYRENNLERVVELEKKKKISAIEIQLSVSKRKIEMDAEIEELKIKKESYLCMAKAKYSKEIKEFKEYLEAIDEMKNLIQETFNLLPKAMSLTIHHHASNLLNEMWNSADDSQRELNKVKLIKFLQTIYEDIQGQNLQLPQKTIKLITEAKNG